MHCDANTSRYKSRREKLSCRGLPASTLASITSDGIWNGGGGGGGRNKLDLGHIFLEMETFLSTDIQNKHLFLWYCSASYYDPEVVKCRFLWMLLSCCTKTGSASTVGYTPEFKMSHETYVNGTQEDKPLKKRHMRNNWILNTEAGLQLGRYMFYVTMYIKYITRGPGVFHTFKLAFWSILKCNFKSFINVNPEKLSHATAPLFPHLLCIWTDCWESTRNVRLGLSITKTVQLLFSICGPEHNKSNCLLLWGEADPW